MPPTLPIDLSNFPAFQTRKALLIIDLQNEFLSPGGSLSVSEPIGYVERGLDVAKRFRESGAGDVLWIRSQFDAHRPTANVRIVTSSTPSLAGTRTAPSSSSYSTSGSQRRRNCPEPPGDVKTNQDQDADPEAFLSIAGIAASSTLSSAQQPRTHTMLPGSFGSELAPQVASAIDACKDLVIAKSHYSAFESTQLLMRLRTRFITELYVFGALTNISIYATALDAARHGLTLTIVEDCCGYRDAIRHTNALQSLVRLTGCDTVLADHVLDTLPTASTRLYQSSTAATSTPALLPGNDFAAAMAAITASSHGPPGARRTGSGGGSAGRGIPVRAKPKTEPTPSLSTVVPDAPAFPPTSLTRSTDPRLSAGASPSPPISPQPTPVPSSSSLESSSAPIRLPPPALTTMTTTDHSPGTEPQSVPPVASMESNMGTNRAASTTCARDATEVAISTVSTPGLTHIPHTSLELGAGEITPDNGDNDSVGAVSEPGDLSMPVLPSRSAKILEYSRLRAKHQADISRKQQPQPQQQPQQQHQASGGVGNSEIGDPESKGSLSQYENQPQQLQVRREVARAATTSKTMRATDEASQPTSPAARKDTLSEKADVRSSNETPKDPSKAAEDSAAPKPEALDANTSEQAKAVNLAQVLTSGASKGARNASKETSERTRNSAPSVSSKSMALAQMKPAVGVADAPLVPVDTTKKPAATEPICAGDTIIYHDVLPAALEVGIYERLCDEVQWQRMSHQGGEVPRLVCVQGEFWGGSSSDGDESDTIPVYRHPADESPPLGPFTPTVLLIKQHVETIVGHPLNHVLIQHYRSGDDYISEHSDKTLDIVPGSFVCNMSVGAERMMIFRTKRQDKGQSRIAEDLKASREEGIDGGSRKSGNKESDSKAAAATRQSCRVPLPHNSLCRMGLETNMKWLHAIRQDRRADRDKREPELAFGGGRISLTFRQIGTFLNKSETLIWGQGAVAKTRAEARPVINGQSDEAVSMLQAFGTENHSSSFDWKRYYGRGYDVLHIRSAPRFFASTDKLVNITIQLLLSELGIAYAKESIGGGTRSAPGVSTTRCSGGATTKKDSDAEDTSKDETREAHLPSSLATAVRFVDNDQDRSTVCGLLAILLYVDSVYGAGSGSASVSSSGQHSAPRRNLEAARTYTRLQQALLLQDIWRPASLAAERASSSSTVDAFSLKLWKGHLLEWNTFVSPTSYSSKTANDHETTDQPSAEMLFVAGGVSPSLADYAFWPVLDSMEQALDTATADVGGGGRTGSGDDKESSPQARQPSFEAQLKRNGMPALAQYYTQLKARESFHRVLAGEKQ